MSRRAALYTLAVRPRSKPADLLPLGDIDGSGTGLLRVLGAYLDGFTQTSRDGTRVIRSLTATTEGDDLFAILQHGQSGIAADIVDPAGEVRLRQTPDDVQLVRCGCLFRAPGAATLGALAVHVNDGRGMKELFEQGLIARFRAQFPGLRLAIDRLVEGSLLGEAVVQNRIEKIRLVRLEQPGARTIAATDKWVAEEAVARIELEVATRTEGSRIEPALIRRYLAGDAEAFAEILEFSGLTFDEAMVEVTLPDETRRLIDITHPGTARPVMRELSGIELDADGEPTADSLLAELRAVLAAAWPQPSGVGGGRSAARSYIQGRNLTMSDEHASADPSDKRARREGR